jgi:16S rRNA (cytidine1402-2'-O)-methyltransferase
MPGILYLVSIPIGNNDDITLRGIKTLSEADFIACEHIDAANALLKRLSIEKPIVECYGSNRIQISERILERINRGESCALISDAGTPAIADPGEYYVRVCLKAGIRVVSVPGPCAAVAALSVSGLHTGRFTFEGFLSGAKKNRHRRLEELKYEYRTMVFYEVSRKLKATLLDMLHAWGNRKVTVLKDLTKPGERSLSTTLLDAAFHFQKTTAKGEYVLVVEGYRG